MAENGPIGPTPAVQRTRTGTVTVRGSSRRVPPRQGGDTGQGGGETRSPQAVAQWGGGGRRWRAVVSQWR
jgi:hypothetical protein